MFVRQIVPQNFLGQGYKKIYSQMADAQIQLYKYTNTQLQHIYNCWQYISNTNIYIGEYMYKFNLYIGIGYILPTIGRYMSIGGCTYAYIRPPTDIYPPIVSSI